MSFKLDFSNFVGKRVKRYSILWQPYHPVHETWQLNPSTTHHSPDNLIILESTRDPPTHTVNIHVSAICIDSDAVVSINPDLLLVLVTHREVRDVLPAIYVIPRRLGYTSKDPCLKQQLPLLGEVEFSSHRALDSHRISGWYELWWRSEHIMGSNMKGQIEVRTVRDNYNKNQNHKTKTRSVKYYR